MPKGYALSEATKEAIWELRAQAVDLTNDGGVRAAQLPGDLAHRLTAGDPARDLLAL